MVSSSTLSSSQFSQFSLTPLSAHEAENKSIHDTPAKKADHIHNQIKKLSIPRTIRELDNLPFSMDHFVFPNSFRLSSYALKVYEEAKKKLPMLETDHFYQSCWFIESMRVCLKMSEKKKLALNQNISNVHSSLNLLGLKGYYVALSEISKSPQWRDARDVQFDSKRMFIIFNRRDLGDEILSKPDSTDKTVFFAIEYFSCTWFAYSGFNDVKDLETELTNYFLIKHLHFSNFIELHSFAFYSKASSPTCSVALITDLGKHFEWDQMCQLPATQRYFRAIDVAQSLNSLHRHNFVYRDISFSNILERNNHCVMADVGSICALSDKEELDENAGTYGFRPFELLQNFKDNGFKNLHKFITKKTDVFAFGAWLTTLFDLPFSAGDLLALDIEEDLLPTKQSVLESHQKEKPTDPNSLEHLIWEMLSTEPDDRPEMDKVLHRLTQLMVLATCQQLASSKLQSSNTLSTVTMRLQPS